MCAVEHLGAERRDPGGHNYLSIPLLIDATTIEYVVSGSVTADMGKWNIKSPLADEGIKVNVGAEYRSESAVFSPDLASEEGNAEGSGGPTAPVSGNYHVSEVFTEVGIPLLDHKPMAESLGLEMGYRYSDYNLGFKTNTYKFGGEWAPTSDFRVRASYSRAVRAPNIGELFAPQAVALDGSTDPCAGPPDDAKGTQAQCVLAGVSAAQYGHIGANSASQYNGFHRRQPEFDAGEIRYLFGGHRDHAALHREFLDVVRLLQHQAAGHDRYDRRRYHHQ